MEKKSSESELVSRYICSSGHAVFSLCTECVCIIRSLLQIHRLHIVGGQHAALARPMHCSCHPAFINEHGIHYNVSVSEGNLITILCLVVIHGLVAAVAAWRLLCCLLSPTVLVVHSWLASFSLLRELLLLGRHGLAGSIMSVARLDPAAVTLSASIGIRRCSHLLSLER